MTIHEVVDLLENSSSWDEWDDNVDKVKLIFGGYPDFWGRIMVSGIMERMSSKFGGERD